MQELSNLYANADLEQVDVEVSQLISLWDDAQVEDPQYVKVPCSDSWTRNLVKGPNLVIQGSVGVGKTYCLYAIANAMRDNPKYKARPTIVDSVSLIENTSPYNPLEHEYLERYRWANLLMIDDLGTERMTDDGRVRLYKVIEHRVAYRLTTVVATNCSPTQLDEHIGHRIVDRLYANAVVAKFDSDARNFRTHPLLPVEVVDMLNEKYPESEDAPLLIASEVFGLGVE